MNTILVRDTLYAKLKRFARSKNVSIESLVEASLVDRLAQMEEWERLKDRLPKSSRADFDRVLAAVPDVPARKGDQWPPKSRRSN